MSQTFHCPNCGAPLDPPNQTAATMRCPFCMSSVIVPEELRGRSPGPDTISRAQAMSDLPESTQVMMDVIRLTRSGNRVEAIRRFREAFDVSYSDAEQTIAAIEQNQVVQLAHPQMQVFSHTSIDNISAVQSPDFVKQILGGQPASYRKKRIPFTLLFFPFLGLLIGCVAVLAVLVLPGAPLFELWSRINPFGNTNLIFSFGEAGELPGQLSEPENIAVDMNGNIFVADMETGRIQQFDPAGKFVRLWDAGDGKIYIRALEVDQNGILYAAVDRTIQRYDTRSGSALEPLPNPEGYFYEDFIVLPNGGFGALVDSETLLRLNADGSIMWAVEDAISSIADENDTGGQLTADGNNNFFVAGRFVESVFKYSSDGRYLNRFGSEGEEPGQLDFIHAIAVDGQGRVYLNDWGDLEIFESDGQFVTQSELPNRAYDIQFGPEGNLYTVSREGKVYVFQIK